MTLVTDLATCDTERISLVKFFSLADFNRKYFDYSETLPVFFRHVLLMTISFEGVFLDNVFLNVSKTA